MSSTDNSTSNSMEESVNNINIAINNITIAINDIIKYKTAAGIITKTDADDVRHQVLILLARIL